MVCRNYCCKYNSIHFEGQEKGRCTEAGDVFITTDNECGLFEEADD